MNFADEDHGKEGLWEIMEKLDQCSFEFSIVVNDYSKEWFKYSIGHKLGDALSLILFRLVVDERGLIEGLRVDKENMVIGQSPLIYR